MAGASKPRANGARSHRDRAPCLPSFPQAVVASALVALVLSLAAADEVSDAVSAQERSDWLACLPLAEAAVKVRPWNERAWHALIESRLNTGDAPGAAEGFEEAFRRFPSSIRLRLAGREALRHVGRESDGNKLVAEIDELVRQAAWRYSDAQNRVLLGRYYLETDADARQVLEVFFDQAKRSSAAAPEPYVAAGELALEKGDFQLAANEFQQALKRQPDHPDAMFGLARAFADSNRQQSEAYLQRVLESVPRYLPALLMVAERQIDGELYEEARETLDQVLEVNPDAPRAWALRSAIAHLEGNPKQADFLRRIALGWWEKNPEVHHLIGAKLSRHYRFAEGATRQRDALRYNPRHVRAKLQLSQDLLRLGEEQEGWKLANEALEEDGYSVLAHNLVELEQQLAKFRTLEDDYFIVRMEATEAAVYGDQVLALLNNARETLCKRYDHELRTPVVVEIFPRQSDFAIRTFGMPGGAGFLGVCFGSVITANSPASQGATPANWASVLWHEFCHVVTLQKTNNRIPRWLSEGISVYEERQRHSSWGQTMTPRYRRMVLGGELTPVSQLSNAFLKPPSGAHLQFAYYESSLVVRHLVEEHGVDSLIRVLNELGQGMPINDSLARTAGSIEALDRSFAAYAEQTAKSLAPKADWTRPPESLGRDTAAQREWLEKHPESIPAMQSKARQHVRQKQWKQAEALLTRLAEWMPEAAGPDSPLAALAMVHQQTGDKQAEQSAWLRVLEVDSQNQTACQRLMDLCEESHDWAGAFAAATRMTQINPLQSDLQRRLAIAARQTAAPARAAGAWRAVLALHPADPAGAHFELAQTLKELGELEDAKRHVLLSLDAAPRYRDAQWLLLQLKQLERENMLPPLESPEPSAPSNPPESPALLPPIETP